MFVVKSGMINTDIKFHGWLIIITPEAGYAIHDLSVESQI